ncbi:DEAD/DEAH box helicase [Vibrio fortis]|uniref:DEAD/DEAH box helicase n=1 Tax=Vibrio fortis TaxID=212667 RepID=UPI0038CD5652
MKFEAKAKKLLSITRSKAKMHEFGLGEEYHIDIPIPPQNLLAMTIGILGDTCYLEKKVTLTSKETELLELNRAELRNVARYFDALDGTGLEKDYSYYLKLLGSAAYYLADMPGSSKVLASQLKKCSTEITRHRLELLLEKLLSDDFSSRDFPVKEPFLSHADRTLHGFEQHYQHGVDDGSLTPYLHSIVANEGVTKFHYRRGGVVYVYKDESERIIHRELTRLRELVYATGTDRELLIIDVIISVAKRKLNSSSRNLLSEATDIELIKWIPILKKSSFIREFWPAQRLLSSKGIFKGNSGVVQLPTSAGKTKSSELILRSSFLSERSEISVLVAPFRALCREISESFKKAFHGEDIAVNELSDIPQIDEWDEQLLEQVLSGSFQDQPQKTVIVSTPEKLVYLLRHNPELKEKIGLVIFDEGHQFDTGTRGVTYELLLSNLKASLKEGTQFVLISAVIANASTIGEWLYGEMGTEVNGADFTSTERSVGFASWVGERGQLRYVEPSQPDVEEFYVPRIIEAKPIPLKGRERKQRYFPERSNSSLAAYFGLKLSAIGPVAVFCGKKDIVNSVCKLMVAASNRIENINPPITFSDRNEINKIYNLACLHLGNKHSFSKAIKIGVLPHSSNIPNGLRIAIEWAMEHSKGKCVVCTSTLAQGVNLPIKYLVISGTFQGQKRISTRDFHNLIGRAGRSGQYTEGSIIFTDTELYDQRRGQKRWHWQRMKELLDPSNSEQCTSSLKKLIEPFGDEQLGVLEPLKFVKNSKKTRSLYLKAAVVRGMSQQDIDSISRQMSERENYIQALESYMLFHGVGEAEEVEVFIERILVQTLAYHLSNLQERQLLSQVFTIVAGNVQKVPQARRAIYGKALLGVEALTELDQWIGERLDILSKTMTNNEMLDLVWPLLCEYTEHSLLERIVPSETLLDTAKLWISGVSYFEIHQYIKNSEAKYLTKTQKREITTDQVIELCDNALGYKGMLIIGAIANLLESGYEQDDAAERFKFLQTSMKLGVGTKFQHFVYSQGVPDREVSKAIEQAYLNLGMDTESYGYDTLKINKGIVDSVLDSLPSCFLM